jgi:aspartyl-tRNA(Asn)/glutamyl-tRNA(Gln) amidotransferase subunit A
VTEEITDLTLCAVADALKARDVSAVEVMEATLARIERLQPKLNAFVTVAADAALAAARRADEVLSGGGSDAPLFGVPLAHKDMIYRKGRISTCGSKIRRDVVADVTSTVLERLDAAGAIEIGTLNMAEFAAGGTGHNEHLGDCRNPWHTDHAPGGSSSGSGSAVAARLVYGALGSDTGGSVRLPAGLCGVVGLKPTSGRITRHGIMPRSWSMDTLGPLARTARDIARLMSVIAGPDPRDPETSAEPVPDYEAGLERPLRGRRIGLPTTYYNEGLDDDVAAARAESADVFRRLGAEVVDVDIPDPSIAMRLAQLLLAAEAAALHERWLLERPQDFSVVVRAPIEPGLYVPATRYIESVRMRPLLLREFIDKVLSRVDTLLVPLMPIPAPTLADSDPNSNERAAHTLAFFPKFTRTISYLGLPALTVPCGFARSGLPVSFQLVGRPFAEAELLNAAHVYQRETAWYERKPAL